MREEKRKVGTILEVSLFKSLKIQAAEENRPMADIIADAIKQYLGSPAAAVSPSHSQQASTVGYQNIHQPVNALHPSQESARH